MWSSNFFVSSIRAESPLDETSFSILVTEATTSSSTDCFKVKKFDKSDSNLLLDISNSLLNINLFKNF